jgi:hypothetical protein
VVVEIGTVDVDVNVVMFEAVKTCDVIVTKAAIFVGVNMIVVTVIVVERGNVRVVEVKTRTVRLRVRVSV